DLFAIAEFDFKRHRSVRIIQTLNVAVHFHAWMSSQDVFRFGKNIFDKGGWNHANRNFTVNAAESQVVNLEAERRNIRPLCGVNIDRKNIVFPEFDVGREIKRKWSIATFVFAQSHAIDPNRRGRHDSFKINEDVFATYIGGQFELAAV